MKGLPLVMVIIDGWGISPPGPGNAITLARLRIFPDLMKRYPHALLRASGTSVGLPSKQVGNSEAGHLNLGAGRIVEQDAVRINHAIQDRTFFRNPALLAAIAHVKKYSSQLHFIGLLTDERSGHAFPSHLYALLKLAKDRGNIPTYLHLITDGRDTSQYEAVEHLHALEKHLTKNTRIATIIGRLWAMDRAKRWSRTEIAYNAIVHGRGKKAATAEQAILDAYNRGESDEFILPTILGDEAQRRKSRIHDDDAVIFFNLRSDRARQITKAFVQDSFREMNPGSFKRTRKIKNLRFIAMTDFGPDLPDILTAFPSPDLADTLPYALHGLRQMYIAESEKFAHITYFFNGGHAAPVAGEERIMVPSSNVESFADDPTMETAEITKLIIRAVKTNAHDVIIANFANADMVGHTGNISAGIRAVQGIDASLGQLRDAVLAQGGTLLVTADHGNIEAMLRTKTGGVDTEHNLSDVPFIVVSKRRVRLREKGILADVAPTILALLDKPKPTAMNRRSLILP